MNQLLAWLTSEHPKLAAGITSHTIDQDRIALRVKRPGNVQQTADAIAHWRHVHRDARS